MRDAYPTDLSDETWAVVSRQIPMHRLGRPKDNPREVVNAIAYRWKTGCSWRELPHDFPSWSTVYAACKGWREDGTLIIIRTILCGDFNG